MPGVLTMGYNGYINPFEGFYDNPPIWLYNLSFGHGQVTWDQWGMVLPPSWMGFQAACPSPNKTWYQDPMGHFHLPYMCCHFKGLILQTHLSHKWGSSRPPTPAVVLHHQDDPWGKWGSEAPHENWMTENLSIFAFVPRAKILPQTPVAVLTNSSAHTEAYSE